MPEPPVQPPALGFTLRSADFAADGSLPQQFTCDGPSPQFSWQDAPSGVRSYALVLEQFDYRSSTARQLWVMTNIPADVSSLPRGYATERGRLQAPVCGGSQRYTYTLFALSQGASIGNGVQSVTRTIRGSEPVFQPGGVLGTASLVGYYNP